ncbi:MAG: HD domain-containing protein [Candidatus Doudnabacteria bacterium]|nr:HD domain-containing protein [Candidatus Doudnabacteria bacterium]
MTNTFVEYRQDADSLEVLLGALFADHAIRSEDQNALESFLAPLRNKGPEYHATYEHSIRVALLGVDVATFMHLDPKVLLFAGLLHDVGKVQVPAATLGKTSGWNKLDTRNMRPHVMDAYRMIRGRFDYSAQVILWHHRFQADGYPKSIPHSLHDYCVGNQIMIPFYGRLLSLCDQFDAFHRVNDKNGALRAPTGEEIKALMLKFNPDMHVLLAELYGANVLTTYTAPIPAIAE